MRKVLRESLNILFAGQVKATVLGEVPQIEAFLGYEDFISLRPEVGDSSWRGAMSKAKQRKWVVSRAQEGVTKFQLTRYGREQIATDFKAFQQVQERSGSWTLLILQPIDGKRQQYAGLKRELEQSGSALVIPSVYAWPKEIYSQDLVRRLESLGFLPCFLPIDPRKSRPSQLESFLGTSSLLQKKTRTLEGLSKDVSILLKSLTHKKNIHHQQKARIGTLLLSGMATLGQFQWFEVDSALIQNQIVPFAQDLDDLAREYFTLSGGNE